MRSQRFSFVRMGLAGRAVLVATLMLTLPCVATFAAGTPATSYIVEITATADGHTGTFSDTFPAGSFTDQLYDLFPTPYTILSNDVQQVPIARIDNLSLEYLADQTAGIALNFGVTGLDVANPVVFSIKSAIIDIDPVPNAVLSAQAGLTITDGEGGAPGVSASGGFGGAKSYQARYNGGSVFASLVDLPFSAPSNDSRSEESPGGGAYSPIGGTLTSLEVEYQFTVSPKDQASGTSVVQTPEPGSLVLLAGSCLLLARRRRAA